MNEYLKLNIMLLISVIFGPLLAFYFTFHTDVYTLSKKYKILTYLTDEWELLGLFLFFWASIYCALTSYSVLKRLLNKPPLLEWWQTDAIYQIYVKSFCDSNDDGVGDLRGIIDKLDYIQSLGVKSIWLNPIYPSGGKDGGYDIVSFVDVDPIYGSIHDFEDLVDEIHKRGMHLLMDFIPNHTSDQHKWFIESCKDKPNNPYKDYYVWVESSDSKNPPNNWKSVFGGSAWTYMESRKAWYLHQFLPEQPDLNLRSADVRKELENTLKYWLEEKKVDGFRIDAVKHLFESENLEDEPLLVPSKFDSINDEKIKYDDLNHLYTANQLETYKLLYSWRRLCNEISKTTNSKKALIVEATYDVEDIQHYYWFENKPNAHFAFNFQLCFIGDRLFKKNDTNTQDRKFRPQLLRNLIEEYFKYLPKGCWANWQTGNHDNHRVASRIGAENVNLANALKLLLGGTSVTYYGEEIGMQDLPSEHLKFDDCQDEAGRRMGPKSYLQYTRDYERTPMQWNETKNCGFTKSSNKPWLPINPNYKELNVDSQESNKHSSLNIFRNLVQLRREPSFQYGVTKIHIVNDQIFSFMRRAFGCDVYLVCMNLSDTNASVNLLTSSEIAPRAYVAYYIPGSTIEDGLDVKYKIKAPILTKSVALNAKDCLILTWPTSD